MAEPTRIEITTPDGLAPAWVHHPAGAGEHPGVVLFPDAGSARPATQEMAERVASWGYVVLLPHIFYRAGTYPPFDFATVFSTPPERERLMKLVRSIDRDAAIRDATAYVGALRAQPGVRLGKVGCIGYCIGGRMAFTTAGALPADVAAAASIHGGGIATDSPESPHLAAARIEAQLYFGIAEDDWTCTAEQAGALVAALAKAHVRFTVDHFPGAKHGFAVRDFLEYRAAAAAVHWRRLEALLADAFAP